MASTHVISTAGHVDHGKSTLVKALTGIHPDRFGEEKQRGLTIDLGFGSCVLPSGATVAIIDVPGHIRFLKNMLAGVGAVDACLFVVSAAEGWMPQSEQHLRILEILGVEHATIALTHCDVVDDELLELAKLDIAERVEGTFLADAEITEVNAVDGTGVDLLRQRLDDLLGRTPRARDIGKARLWIDRSFAIKGSGTVVTGTLTGGGLAVGDELLLAPQKQLVRVRSIQSLHRDVVSVAPGSRVALNLSGVNHNDVERGNVLVRQGQWFHSSTFDAGIEVLDSLDRPLSRRGAYMAYLGSGEYPCVLRVLGPDAIEAGDSGFVRIRLASAFPMCPGDRFVLRESGRSVTVGGGEILDIDPVTKASKAKPDRSVDRVIAERGWVRVDELELLTGVRREASIQDWVVEESVLAESISRLEQRIDAADGLGVELAALTERERALVQSLDDVEIDGTHVRKVDADLALATHPFVLALNDSLFEPPSADGVDKVLLNDLVRRSLIIRSEGIFFAAEAVRVGAQRLIRHLESKTVSAGVAGGAGGGNHDAEPSVGEVGATVSEIREIWGTSRKYALPLLAYFDANGLTRRRDNLRIAGPRLVSAAQ